MMGDSEDAGEGAKGKLSCVAVYCGSKPPKNEVFNQRAQELGQCLAARGVAVVYGGGDFGLMGKMAHAVLDSGGDLTGIIPKFFTEHEGYCVTGKEVVVQDMHARKKMLFEQAEAFIALPGGVGTMEELTEIITWSGLQLHNKPIAVLNVEGYYDHFLQWMKRGVEEGFIPCPSGKMEDLLLVEQDPNALVDKLCAMVTSS